jgi:5-methylcytosine-specific restriction enzyme A
MPRSVSEWIGRTDDTPVPPRVRLRVLDRFGRRCDPRLGCGRPLRPGDAWTCDHIQAVINGGANRESNLHPLCEWCEPLKTAVDMQEKSRSYRKRLRHAGIKVAPKGRPLPGTIASGWKHRMNGGWERRASKRFGGRSAIEGGPAGATTCRGVSK